MYTSDVDGSAEGARGKASWQDPPRGFTASSGSAMLCFELRNLRDRSNGGRSLLGKPGSRSVFDSLGSVRCPTCEPCMCMLTWSAHSGRLCRTASPACIGGGVAGNAGGWVP